MTLPIVIRCASYSTMMLGCILLNNRVFYGSDISLMSLLALGSFVIELLMPNMVKQECGKVKFCNPICSSGQTRTFWRTTMYALCVIGVTLMGGWLIMDGMKVRESSKPSNHPAVTKVGDKL